MTETVCVINMPLPPTISAAYRNVQGVGRVKSTDTKRWTAQAFAGLAAQGQARAMAKIRDANLLLRHMARGKTGKVSVQRLWKENRGLSYRLTITYTHADDSIGRDMLNLDKMVPDFLVDAGFMLDDCFVDWCLQVRALPDVKAPGVIVEIITIDKRLRVV